MIYNNLLTINIKKLLTRIKHYDILIMKGLVNNMKNVKTPYKKVAKTVKVISDISFWVIAVLGVISLLSLIISSFIPDSSFILTGDQLNHVKFSFDGMLRFSANKDQSYINLKPYLQSMSLLIAIYSSIFAVILYELRKILKAVLLDKPFDKENSKCLTIIAAILMIGSLFVNIARVNIGTAFVKITNITGISINYNIDFSMLLYGILILMLAGIFKYGCYLQEEYDATL